MNREITFRGKDPLSGNWVYGLIYNYSYRGEILTYIQDSDYAFKNGSLYGEEVQSNTIGQYTGLKDRNNKEIYEGDIVQLGADRNTKHYREIKWERGAFHCKQIHGSANFPLHFVDFDQENDWEVVGNIYENPEFLMP